MDIQDLVKALDGKLYGNDDFFSIDGFTGKFTFLHEAHTGDIVIREWIDPVGVEMAFNQNIACLITHDARGGAVETAERFNFPLIVIDNMDLAKRFVSQYSKTQKIDDINDIINQVQGKIVGNNEFFSIDGFTGRYTFLNDAHTGDIVVRHWINPAGIEIHCLSNHSNPKGWGY